MVLEEYDKKIICPHCHKNLWIKKPRPQWICLGCGRIYDSVKERNKCECNRIINYNDSYPLEFNFELKQRIRKRDNKTCQHCGKKQIGIQYFAVHHIDEIKNNIHPDNLITLCRSCHIKLHRSNKCIVEIKRLL